MQFSVEYVLPVLFVAAAAAALLHLRVKKRKIRQERYRKRLRGIEVIVDENEFSKLRGNAVSEPDYQTAEQSFLRALRDTAECGAAVRKSAIRARP
jgi:hypothetical protein